MVGDLSYRYLGVKNSNKIHQNFLPCLLVLIYGVFLAFLAVSGRFQRVLVLSLFVPQDGLGSEGLVYQPKETGAPNVNFRKLSVQKTT